MAKRDGVKSGQHTTVTVLEAGGETWKGLSHCSCSWPEPHAEGEEGCQGCALALPPGIERRTEFSDTFDIVLLSSSKVKDEFPLTAVGTHLGLH